MRLAGLAASYVVCAVALCGCFATFSAPTYSISADNNRLLKRISGKGFVGIVEMPPNAETRCRLLGVIAGAEGKSIGHYVEAAFNDELKFADRYSEDGRVLFGNLTKVELSSTEGYWSLDLTVSSSNGSSTQAQTTYSFPPSFEAGVACAQAAQALTAAVQALILKLVLTENFDRLLE